MAISNCFHNVKWLYVLMFLLAFNHQKASFAAQTYNLLDYRGPSTVGTTWIYSGRDWDGLPSGTRMQIISTQQPITSYTNGVTATPYSVNVIDIRYDYGTANPDHTFTSTDEWHEYRTVNDGYRMWGDDDDEESLRVDGGLNFGTTLTIGQTNSRTAAMYDGGSYIGNVSASITLLDISNVTVPAGTFTDCLHLRFNFAGTQSHDEWWAAGFGVVKMQGLSGSGGGSGQLRELEWYSFKVTGSFSNILYAHDNVAEGVDALYAVPVTTVVNYLSGSMYSVNLTAPDGSVTATLTQTGELDGSLLRTVAPVDFAGWNLLDFYYLSNGSNQAYAFRGQEDSNPNDISISGSAFSDSASVTADDFVGIWKMDGFNHGNLKNPADHFITMSREFAVSKTDATHLMVTIEGHSVPLLINNHTASLQSGPFVLTSSRLVSFQMSTDGKGVSIYAVSTELNDHTDAHAFIGLSDHKTALSTISPPSPGINLLLLKGNNAVIEDDADKDGDTVAQGDCNDSDATIHPGATEVCGDDIDQDCNGSDLDCNESVEYIFSDNFEFYEVGTFPSSGGWILRYNGAGTSQQYVDDTESVSGSNSFHLAASSYCWASTAYRPVDVSGTFSMEVNVKLDEIVSCGCSPYLLQVGVSGYYHYQVRFDCDGNIYSFDGDEQTLITTYDADVWYKVKIVCDATDGHFDVYINDTKYASNLSAAVAGASSEVYVSAGHGSYPVAWFDDIKIYSDYP